MRKRQLVYMAHPVQPAAGETIGVNLERAKAWLKRLAESFPEVVIIAPWITECELWDDSDKEQRAAGLARCHEVIARCDAFWMVGDRISSGMAGECEVAMEFELAIHDMTRIDEVT
ncbi:MAG: hypothetical protein GY811_23400 [Myxococcales bacterium]|nr:hypothetical protein [Myxococcales bacterium]